MLASHLTGMGSADAGLGVHCSLLTRVGTERFQGTWPCRNAHQEINHVAHKRRSSQFHRRNFAGHDQLPRMDRRRLGDLVFASQGLHAGVHHGTGLHGRAAAGIREAQLQDHRAERGPGEQPQQVGRGHRRDAGPQGEIPDDRRPGTEGRQALRHAAGRRRRYLRRPHRGRPTPRCARCSWSVRTRRSS